MRVQVCIAVFLVLVGCDDDEECQATTDRIQQRLDAMPPGPTGLVPGGVEAPEAEGEPLAYRVPELVIGVDGSLTLDGERKGSPEAVGEALRSSERLQRVADEEDRYPAAIHIWADRSLPYAQLQRVIAPLSWRDRWLLVTSPRTDPLPPCPESLGAACELPDDPSSRATVLAEAFTPIVEGCEPLSRLFRRVASLEVEEKGAAFQRGFAPALRECDCDLDMPAVEYLAVVLVRGPGGRVGRIRVTGSGVTDGTVGDWVAAHSTPRAE